MKNTFVECLVVVWAVVLSGCGLSMHDHYSHVRPKLLERDFEGALAYVDSVKESFYGKDNALLYFMDKGSLLSDAKRYKESNACFEQAKDVAEALYTESIHKHIESYFTTDNALPYPGEDFEKVMLHVVSALNNVGASDLSSGLVEARQVSEQLTFLNDKYETKSVYKDDAFTRWLSGKIHEQDQGNDMQALNDAWID